MTVTGPIGNRVNICWPFNHHLSLFAEYPEIETWGFSFNTNIGGHTVQGDFNYRPDMPIQIDTDVLTINSCLMVVLLQVWAALKEPTKAGSTMAGERGNYNTMTRWCAAGTVALATGADAISVAAKRSYIQGWVEEYDVSSWNIGTTSIFTSSNPLCSGFWVLMLVSS